MRAGPFKVEIKISLRTASNFFKLLSHNKVPWLAHVAMSCSHEHAALIQQTGYTWALMGCTHKLLRDLV